MVKNPDIASISLDGETLCMNFINTVHNRTDDPLPDYLKNPLDLVAWAEKVKLVDEKAGRRLQKAVSDSPKKARHFFSEAIFLREVLYRMFLAIAANKKISH